MEKMQYRENFLKDFLKYSCDYISVIQPSGTVFIWTEK